MCWRKKSKVAVILVKKLGQMNPDLLVSIKKIPCIRGRDRQSQRSTRNWTFVAHVIQEYVTRFWPPISQIWFLNRLECQRHPMELRKRKIQTPMKASLKTTKKNIMKCTTGSTLCWQTDCNFCHQGLTFCKFCHRK